MSDFKVGEVFNYTYGGEEEYNLVVRKVSKDGRWVYSYNHTDHFYKTGYYINDVVKVVEKPTNMVNTLTPKHEEVVQEAKDHVITASKGDDPNPYLTPIPNNGNSVGKGHRYNVGKPAVELLVPEAMIETAKVWGFGAKKYSAHNWRKGIGISSIIGCILRHTFAIMRGEDMDKDSGCMHAAHIACNAQMLIYFYKTDQYSELDDRYKKKGIPNDFKYEGSSI